MSNPAIQLDNATASLIPLVQLGIDVPASGSILATDSVLVDDVVNDPELNAFIDAGDITLTVDAVVLTEEQSKAYIGYDRVLDNDSAAAAPTVNDDADAGYRVKSMWIDTTNDSAYICVDATNGAAVWAGGVTTPGTTIDLGVVVWDGLTGTAIADAGIREYGKSATDPTVPTPADGDGYYNTALNMRMTYDGSRSKWLSGRTAELWFGRSGNTGTGAYYRGPGNRAYSSTIGRNATHDGTIVSLTYTRADSDAATFQITADGVTISTLASAAQKGESVTLNNDFSAGAVIGARNAAGGNATRHVQGWAVIRWRS